MTNCRAAKKFRDLWALTRNVPDGAAYAGVPHKPMNRVVMVLLGVLADDSAAMERTELRAIAYAWFIDCAKHNDLHRILQVRVRRGPESVCRVPTRALKAHCGGVKMLPMPTLEKGFAG